MSIYEGRTSDAAYASDLAGNHVIDMVTLPLSSHYHLSPISGEVGGGDGEILHVDTLQFLVPLSINLSMHTHTHTHTHTHRVTHL